MNFLKGALDILTNNTIVDTGTGTYLSIVRPTIGDWSFRTNVTGDNQPRWTMYANGNMNWGPGGSGIVDTNLYRRAANELATDGSFVLEGAGYIDLVQRTGAANPPVNPPANRLRLFCQDDGFGKTRLSVRFPTGATQVLATQT